VSRALLTISGTSPAAAGTAVIGTLWGLEKYDWFTVDALLVGATGGVLDIYLQRQVARDAEVSGGVWVDWAHYTQLAAGGSAINYSIQTGSDRSIVTVATGTDASAGTPALAANTFAGGHPGSALRCVAVAGASTSAGAAVKIYVNAFLQRHY
jgi:hypothetical protein